MKELVLYYSYTGNTAQLAGEFAGEHELALCEILTERPLGKFAAYAVGCFKALKGVGMPIEPPAKSLDACETAHIFAPVWAGHIAPPMASAIVLLPKGAALHLHMVSRSGNSEEDRVTARLRDAGYTVETYEDIRK